MDFYYVILIGPALLLTMWAQWRLKSTFSKYSNVPCSNGISGSKTAAALLQANNIRDVKIGPVPGSLSDHYAPAEKQIGLSEPVFNVSSIAAVGVAAHEVGHAIQYATGYKALAIRAPLRRFSGIASTYGPYIAMAGLAMPDKPFLVDIGIALFSVAVLCSIMTLPVEFNASSRALAALRDNKLLTTDDELKGAKKVLSAAALTYVAGALTNFMSLVRLILLKKNRRR